MSVSMLSFDVEDWFQVENLSGVIDRSTWDDRELRVGKNTRRILDLLKKHDTTATFFVLGWVADRLPDLVKEISARGHEVASHGYHHELLTDISNDRFEEDLIRSRNLLEDLSGETVRGYRAPSYSITEDALDILQKHDFTYDSSYFPSSIHDRYTDLASVQNPSEARFEPVRDRLREVVISTWNQFGLQLPWGGGGYFRMIPYSIFLTGIRRILSNRGMYVFYLHPWEIDPDQPRVKNLSPGHRFRHYTGLARTEDKLDRLLSDVDFVSIKEGLQKRSAESIVKEG